MPSKRKTGRRPPDVGLAARNAPENSPGLYDPLDLRTLAESMAKVVLEQPVVPLASLTPFEGPGIYVMYYTGGFPAYSPISSENQRGRWDQPIYVGEAARKGARKGGVLTVGEPGRELYSRLGNHVDSIRETKSLEVGDFFCRYLPMKDFFIPLCESLLIDRYQPIWNKLIDGFGNKAVGKRRKRQRKSMWDTIHPGRRGAALKPNKRFPTAETVIAAVEKFFAGKPVPLISTPEAVKAAEAEGEVESPEEDE